MKTKILIIIFIVLISLTTNVYASTLGTISYWYDTTSNNIGRWNYTPYLWASNVDSGFTSAQFATYVSHATSQWSSAGISTNGIDEEGYANIRIKGGTYNTLHALEPDITPTDAGLTVFIGTYEGEWVYNGANKTGYLCVSPIMVYIISKSGKSDNGYKNTTTHELGHALGWMGHTSNSSDIMYGTETEVTVLTSRDKNHLNQIY